ncbi:MAG: sensor histidine kinase [Actinomycetales bacterium]|nr:sensor histidine kinase [Actinomycetales bacterium]
MATTSPSTPGRPTTEGGPPHQPGRGGRWTVFWVAIWTFFLLEPLEAGWARRDEAAGWIGMAATLAFAAWYVGSFIVRRRGLLGGWVHPRPGAGVVTVGVATALAVVVCVSVGQSGTAAAVYVGVLAVLSFRGALGLTVAAVNAATWYAAGLLVPGWERDNALLLSMLTAGLAVFGFTQMISGNARLRMAQEENQRLAISEERNRFARDLHDILGHSLTVITVKAELAGRLVDAEPDRARAEIADLERLSRDALADVRRAVDGYRELTLPGELARARAALEAAEIRADLPNATDQVPGELRELFAWTIREGVTNVIRHSGASRCTVRLQPDTVEVLDDGRGPGAGDTGHGLTGLRERATRLGASVVTAAREPRGFALRVAAPARENAAGFAP